jgi:hypothetical protein
MVRGLRLWRLQLVLLVRLLPQHPQRCFLCCHMPSQPLGAAQLLPMVLLLLLLVVVVVVAMQVVLVRAARTTALPKHR